MEGTIEGHKGVTMTSPSRFALRILFTALILVNFGFVSLVMSQVRVIPYLQRDDLEYQHSWWELHNEPLGHNYQSPPTFNNGYLHHKLIAPEYFGNTGNFLADSMNNVGIESATIDALYAPGDTLYLKMRVRFLTDHQPGSRGFGWWYKEGEPITVLEQMWFMQAREVDTSPYRDQDTWWRAEKANGLYYSRHDSVDLDYALLPDWHLYEIYKYGNNRVDFLIDGSIVLTSTTYLPDEYYDYHHWIDNLVYHSTDLGNDQFSIDAQPRHGTQWDSLTATNEMVTDFIEIIYGATIQYGYSQPASGIVSLREYVNEIAYNGGTDQLWKSYSFTTNGGTTVILATAKAEEYDGYDTADKLRMVIDGTNYGTATYGWDGDVQQATPKIVRIDTSMNSGSHTIQFYNTTTPLLYDVVVLNAQSGGVILDSVINQTAPAGSNNLEWISIPFNVPQGGEVAIYVVAEADENDGWAYRGPGDSKQNIFDDQDDDLRMVLDGTDYGWQTDSSWYGNRDFGEVKTVLLHETLAAGSHTLTFYANNTPTLYRVIIFAENDNPLPVTLQQFSANVTAGGIELQWTTASEVDNVGFYIYRAEGDSSRMPEAQAFRRINLAMIEGAGNSNEPRTYTYRDEFVEPGKGYWYQLADVSVSGKQTFHNPIWVQFTATVPKEFQVFQNYPNPFNPSTTIPFTLPQQSRVTVMIYDLNGRLVRELLDDVLSAGTHQVQWDGRLETGGKAPAGIYFYTIKADGFTATRKMVLIP